MAVIIFHIMTFLLNIRFTHIPSSLAELIYYNILSIILSNI